MAGSITQSLATSFKVELLQGYHSFGPGYRPADTFKIALLKGAVKGTYGAATTNYSEVVANWDEVTGTGYVAGGNTLVISNPPSSGPTPATTAWVSFLNSAWMGSTLTSAGAIIYNASQGNRAVMILSFGQIITQTNFTVVFPSAVASTAILQLG